MIEILHGNRVPHSLDPSCANSSVTPEEHFRKAAYFFLNNFPIACLLLELPAGSRGDGAHLSIQDSVRLITRGTAAVQTGGQDFFFSTHPPPFLRWSQSINNLHNFSTSIFNVLDKGLLCCRSQSGRAWCLLLWNSPQTQTVPKGPLVLRVRLPVCACTCNKGGRLRFNVVVLLSFFIVIFKSAFVFLCLWGVAAHQRGGASKGLPRSERRPLPTSNCLQPLSAVGEQGEGKISGGVRGEWVEF